MPLKLNSEVSERVAKQLTAEKADRRIERLHRQYRSRIQHKRMWQLLAIDSAILAVVLPFAMSIAPFTSLYVSGLLCIVAITPISEYWRRRFRLTQSQMAAAMGGGGFVAASLNIIYLYIG